jgi:hypothetical protein
MSQTLEEYLQKAYARNKRWADKNKEHIAAYQKEYYQKNKQRINEQKKQWKKKYLAKLRAEAANRALLDAVAKD